MTEEELFVQAIEIPREKREAFLRETCDENGATKTRIEKLLAAHESGRAQGKTSMKRGAGGQFHRS